MKQVSVSLLPRTILCVVALIAASPSASAYEYSDLGTIILASSWRCPPLTTEANGQILQINSNQSLYSLLGTSYGGDGRQTFGLPDLRGEAPTSSNGQELRYCIISSLTEEDSAPEETTRRLRDRRIERLDSDSENEVVPARRGTSRNAPDDD